MYYALVIFNIFLPFMPMSSNWPLSFGFPDRNFFEYLVSYACYTLWSSDIHWLYWNYFW